MKSFERQRWRNDVGLRSHAALCLRSQFIEIESALDTTRQGACYRVHMLHSRLL